MPNIDGHQPYLLAPPERSDAAFFLSCRARRQARVSETDHDCGMDFILLTPGVVELIIAVCVALLFGMATYLALT